MRHVCLYRIALRPGRQVTASGRPFGHCLNRIAGLNEEKLNKSHGRCLFFRIHQPAIGRAQMQFKYTAQTGIRMVTNLATPTGLSGNLF